MLSAEDNEAITRVGPGTIMGDLMRQYWMPALLSSEVPEPDGAPVRIRLLCENLIAFRVTSGRVVLIQDACPHRGASFFFGRNEEEGIRCVYHGWKFNADGQCTEMLNEPAPSGFMERVRARTYPCVERNGVVWTYMGPNADPPALPDIEPNMIGSRGRVNVNMYNWNWLQAVENNMDTAHQGILHFGSVPLEDALDPVKAQEVYPGQVEDLKYIVGQRSTTFVVKETDFGASYGAYRPGDADTTYWRTMHFMFPWYTTSPVLKVGPVTVVWANVPIDDYHTMNWTFSEAPAGEPGTPPTLTTRPGLLPNTNDWLGRFRLKYFYDTVESGDYDFGVDREVQKTSKTHTGYTGLPSVPIQDVAIVWSQGVIQDRTKENLGTTDAMIVRVRRILLSAARALRESGTVPPGIENPEVYHQRSGWALLPKDADFWEYLRPVREAFEGVK